MSSLKIVLHSFALVVDFMQHEGQARVLKIAVGFLVNNEAFGQIFLQLLSFSLSATIFRRSKIIFHSLLPTLYNHRK